MSWIRADIVHYKGDREHIGIRRRIANTHEELAAVLKRHMEGLCASTGHDWTISFCPPSDEHGNTGFLDYYEIRSKATDHWFWVIAQCGVF